MRLERGRKRNGRFRVACLAQLPFAKRTLVTDFANLPDVDVEDSAARFLPFIHPSQRQLLRAQCETPNRIWL